MENNYKTYVIAGMYNEVMKKFGKRIKSLREEKGWTQEDLAFRTGFHRTYIGMVERGERNLSLINIKIFADSFNISLPELMNFEG